MRVLATREGLEGKPTASGFLINDAVSFVALPSRKALGRFVRVANPLNGRTGYAQVLDVGPWNIEDDAYVFGGQRPQAESGKDLFGRVTNRAGIDLGQRIYTALGMTGNGEVDWEFLP